MSEHPAIDRLEPFIKRLPAVSKPEGHVHFRRKLTWTVGVLVIYFILTNVPIFGLSPQSQDLFGFYRAIMAGSQGSLVQLGIGPIVTASIILQLFKGADIIKLDTSDPRDQAVYQQLQKFLIFIMIVVEAVPQVLGGFLLPNPALAASTGLGLQGISLLILFQIIMGGVLVLFLDEVVSKWGIGSGVGMFIVAGVAQGLVTGTINWQPDPTTGLAVGIIPRIIEIFQQFTLQQLLSAQGLAFFLFRGDILAAISTIAIFIIVVYVETTRIEIPLAHSAVRGARGRFPVKLVYASVLPLILVRALQANIQMIGILLYNAGFTWVGTYQGNQPTSGLMYYLAPINSPANWFPGLTQNPGWQVAIRASIDISFMVIGGIVFALFWVETTGMGPKAVAEQIKRSGMSIPGFRRDPKIIEKVMKRYIPRVTVIGGAFIGLLACVAGFFGTIGNVGGTSLLLAVSIVYRLYEQLANEEVMEMHPMLRGFLGE
ncbi:MAG: preprotein translocase subunit SecY [Halobacteriota archaeon]